ncbi:MAG: aminoacyl-tRNA hydrolase [Holosporaceae bacterium]|nr:aminoacyl-tRNA hydrolase [Holosporaceae bacterium]
MIQLWDFLAALVTKNAQISSVILLMGLGNPGAKYLSNRHNVGFTIIDRIADLYGACAFKKIPDIVDFAQLKLPNGTVLLLVKPQTFMNLSGRAVSYLMRTYKIPLDNVYVVHDDIDLSIRRVKIKQGGGSGGHNGIKHIDETVGSSYWRIRVGVGRPADVRMYVAAHVLMNFPQDEQIIMNEVYLKIAKNIEHILANKRSQELDLDKLQTI